MVGLPEMTQYIQKLEQKAKKNDNFEEIEQLFNDIESVFNQKIKLVENEFERLRQ